MKWPQNYLDKILNYYAKTNSKQLWEMIATAVNNLISAASEVHVSYGNVP